MLPRKNRLNLSQRKNRGGQTGKRVESEDFSLTFHNTVILKAAIIVSKKVAPLAVDRNRIKRLLSEAIQKQNIVSGNLLIVVRKNISKFSQESVSQKLEKLLFELKNV
jgi:ribonuclease P protein component